MAIRQYFFRYLPWALLSVPFLALSFTFCGKAPSPSSSEGGASRQTSLETASDRGTGVNLLLWSHSSKGAQSSQRCWYYKEHAASAPDAERYGTSVRLKPNEASNADLLAALKDKHRIYSLQALGKAIPLSSCFGTGGFSLTGCLSYFQAVGYAGDRAYGVAFAIMAVSNNATDLDSTQAHPANALMSRDYTKRVAELQIRELVDSIKKLPNNSAAARCKPSNAVFAR